MLLFQVQKNQTPGDLGTTTLPPVVTTVSGSPAGKAPDAPTVAPGEASVVIDGRAVATTVTRADNEITATAGERSTTISGLGSDGKRVALDVDGNLVMHKGQRLTVSATGFKGLRKVKLWMYSTPTQLGVIETLADGTVSGAFDLPSDLDIGSHRLVLESEGSDGQTEVVAIGFIYGDSNSSSTATRVLIAIPIALAILFGLFLPAISRRRKKEATAQ